MLTFRSPTTECCTLSGVRSPTLSRISLLASSCTYSDFAELESCTSLCVACTALSPIVFAIWDIMYFCTLGSRSVRLALTLPPSPFEYPAFMDASRILQPSATSVSTSAFCLAVRSFELSGNLFTLYPLVDDYNPSVKHIMVIRYYFPIMCIPPPSPPSRGVTMALSQLARQGCNRVSCYPRASHLFICLAVAV